ncbi:hypothetical protein DIDNDMLP_00372 [Klebsiella phage KP13-7]|nr:hypothetical protein DIDNDMLP_00372 [Klebsiella phage KP13-7]
MNILQKVNLFGKAYVNAFYDIDKRYEYANFLNREIEFSRMNRLLSGKRVTIIFNGYQGYINQIRHLDKKIFAFVYTNNGNLLVNVSFLELIE